MIHAGTVLAGIVLVRATESWEAVIFSGLIPFIGAVAVLALIWRAIKSNPENDLPPEERVGAGWVHGLPPAKDPAAVPEQRPEQNQQQKEEGGPKGPPS
jgi:hypothetical protein